MLAASIVLGAIVLLAFVRPHLVVDEHQHQKAKAKAPPAIVSVDGIGTGTGTGKGSRSEAERGRPRTSKVLSDSNRYTYTESVGSVSGGGVEGEPRDRSVADV